MIPVSAYTGQGIDELKAQIISLVDGAEEKSYVRPFRLPVDRVFTVDGFGTVVTGTLVEGTVKTGETVTIYPCGEKARVRGIQSHGTPGPAGRSQSNRLDYPGDSYGAQDAGG